MRAASSALRFAFMRPLRMSPPCLAQALSGGGARSPMSQSALAQEALPPIAASTASPIRLCRLHAAEEIMRADGGCLAERG